MMRDNFKQILAMYGIPCPDSVWTSMDMAQYLGRLGKVMIDDLQHSDDPPLRFEDPDLFLTLARRIQWQYPSVAWIRLGEYLVTKNQSYGDSATNPIQIMAGGIPPHTLILVRMDDKLSRIARGKEMTGETFEDAVTDFFGYVILYVKASLKPSEKGNTSGGTRNESPAGSPEEAESSPTGSS